MLRTGILSQVLDAVPSLRVVVLSPLVKDSSFVREFSHPRISFEDLPPHRPVGREARLIALMQACYLESGVTSSVKIRREEALAKGIVRWLPAKRLLAKTFAPSLARPESRYDLIDRLVSHPDAERLFDQHRPVMVVTSNPGLIFPEVPLLRTARRRGIKSMAIDPSWDNFTNKLLPVRRTDRLIVWNTIMKDQAVALHGYQPDELLLAGTPQWDSYFRDGVLTSREEFCARIGANPAAKLVTLTTSPQELYGYFQPVIEQLARACEQGRWPHEVQLLVRVHPRDAIEQYAGFANRPGVIIEKPFKATNVRSGDGMTVDITADATRHLANTMHHSDVVVQVSSTIAIEASIFDTPVVNIAFDGDTTLPFARSALRYTQFTHWRNISETGAVREATTPEQMLQMVGRYLDEPGLDREGRRRVVLEQCQFLDGKAAERVGAFVIDEMVQAIGRAEQR
ncbi:MAG TPA: hypothetical protein VNT81_08825 [Vicinamibacterales bacterium]|nr:hypothetical protein [Vicinamibacterales bacterium]